MLYVAESMVHQNADNHGVLLNTSISLNRDEITVVIFYSLL